MMKNKTTFYPKTGNAKIIVHDEKRGIKASCKITQEEYHKYHEKGIDIITEMVKVVENEQKTLI
jgi:hypothetical protein